LKSVPKFFLKSKISHRPLFLSSWSMFHFFSNNEMVDVIPLFFKGLRSTTIWNFWFLVDFYLDPDLKTWLQILDPDMELGTTFLVQKIAWNSQTCVAGAIHWGKIDHLKGGRISSKSFVYHEKNSFRDFWVLLWCPLQGGTLAVF